jgi:hypothetical protein
MTIKDLKAHVAQAQTNHIFSKPEVAKSIEIVGPTVSNGEAKVLADLYTRMTEPEQFAGQALRPGVGALEKLEAYAADRKLPIGDNQVAALAQGIQELLMRVRFARGPGPTPTMNLSSYVSIPLDGNTRAYIDVVQKRFELEYDNNGVKSYQGPLGLPDVDMTAGAAAPLTATRLSMLTGRANDLMQNGTVNWGPNTLAENTYVEKSITANNYPDAINISVIVPTAGTENPNRVDAFYLHQVGGIAGFNLIAGPFSLRGDV